MSARDDDWIALSDAAAEVVRKARPVFALRVEYAGTAGFEIHGLRRLLKDLLRRHRFRCISIEQVPP